MKILVYFSCNFSMRFRFLSKFGNNFMEKSNKIAFTTKHYIIKYHIYLENIKKLKKLKKVNIFIHKVTFGA